MNLNHILIFKTDIQTKDQVAEIASAFINHSQIIDWNVDVEDIDCVLRIVSETLSCDEINDLLQQYGHFCCELE